MKKTSDAVVLFKDKDEYKLLLITRKNPPYKGEYAFPGGFIDEGENPLDACVRELFEETDLELDKSKAFELSVRSKDGRDPRGPTTTYPFLFIVENPIDVKAKDDALTAKWVSLNEIQRLAFDHGAILCEALGRLWPSMPGYVGSEKGGDEELVFFGGSFNPWHEGHEECVRLFTENFKEKSLIVLPDTNPWKEIESREDNYCYYESFLGLKKRLEGYPVKVYPGFWGMESHNATYDWFIKVKAKKRGILVGDDQFVGLPNWKNANKLLDFMDFLFVVPRNLMDNKRDQVKDDILSNAKKLEVFILSDHDYKHVSSTDIRKRNGR